MITRSHKRYPGIPLLGGMLLGLAMIGCVVSDPFQPPMRDEIPEGPGLFTGSKGAWVISHEFGTRTAPTEATGNPSVEPSVPQAQPSASPAVPAEVTPRAPAIPKRKAPPL